MTILVNFSDKNFEQSRIRLNASALSNGIDKILSRDETFIKNTDFFKNQQKIFKNKKGFGYWIWKPFLILDALNNSNNGDVIVYSDAGIEITDNISPLVSLCLKHDILLFANAKLKNSFWVKRDCFILMNADSKNFWNGPQTDASFCLFSNSEQSKNFVEEWLSYCVDERIIGDMRNLMGRRNFWGFQAHRHDQSVLSLLAIKHHIELFRQPSQFGNYYKSEEYRVEGEFKCVNQFNSKQVQHYSLNPCQNSPYFQLLNHHRNKIETPVKEDISFVKRMLRPVTRRIQKVIKFLSRQ